MIDLETIQGDRIKKVFEGLKKDRSLVKMRLAGRNFESLTIVTGFRRKFSKHYLLLDMPEGFQAATEGVNAWRIALTFTGQDHIQYAFTASDVEIYRDQISVRFPDIIHRNQRRKNFRLEAPEGTHVKFRLGEIDCCEKVLDVSIGGALIALVCLKDRCQGDFPFSTGDILEDLTLVFPLDQKAYEVPVKKAEVVRIDNGEAHPDICCGLKFIEIDGPSENRLTDYIYQYQRKFLRNRLRVDL